MKSMHKKRNAAVALMAVALMLPAGAQAGSWGGDHFEKSDTNKDGALSKEEMQTARLSKMQGADADKDGFITSDELVAQHTMRMQENKDKHYTHFSEKFDANKDGKVSVDEVQSYESPHFTKADTNSDGKLTKEEMKAAKSMWHGDKDGDKDSSD